MILYVELISCALAQCERTGFKSTTGGCATSTSVVSECVTGGDNFPSVGKEVMDGVVWVGFDLLPLLIDATFLPSPSLLHLDRLVR